MTQYYLHEQSSSKLTFNKSNLVFYDQFCFDLLAMFGVHLMTFSHSEFEQAMRSLFLKVTMNENGDVRLRNLIA